MGGASSSEGKAHLEGGPKAVEKFAGSDAAHHDAAGSDQLVDAGTQCSHHMAATPALAPLLHGRVLAHLHMHTPTLRVLHSTQYLEINKYTPSLGAHEHCMHAPMFPTKE